MWPVKVSRAGESLCYDELASGSCTGYLTEGMWVISVNTFHANTVILGSCSKKAAAYMSVWFLSLSCTMISCHNVSKLPICEEGKQRSLWGAELSMPCVNLDMWMPHLCSPLRRNRPSLEFLNQMDLTFLSGISSFDLYSHHNCPHFGTCWLPSANLSRNLNTFVTKSCLKINGQLRCLS